MKDNFNKNHNVDIEIPPFSTPAFVILILISNIIPLIGYIIGAINLKRPLRKDQAQWILAASLAGMIAHTIFWSIKIFSG